MSVLRRQRDGDEGNDTGQQGHGADGEAGRERVQSHDGLTETVDPGWRAIPTDAVRMTTACRIALPIQIRLTELDNETVAGALSNA